MEVYLRVTSAAGAGGEGGAAGTAPREVASGLFPLGKDHLNKPEPWRISDGTGRWS